VAREVSGWPKSAAQTCWQAPKHACFTVGIPAALLEKEQRLLTQAMPDLFTLETSAGRKILRYLVQNPAANDTVEGIAEWWLLEQRIEQSVAEVTAVLSKFVEQGLIIRKEGLDGRFHYRVNADKGPELLNILNAASIEPERPAPDFSALRERF
jgi:hypothetical protein